MRNLNFRWNIIVVFSIILITQQSCFSYRKQILFQDIPDSTANISLAQPDPVIQRGDQLMIRIYAMDPESAGYFNQPMGFGGGSSSMMMNSPQSSFLGYLVNEQGQIEFPKLGTLNVLGYTQKQLRDSLQIWLLPYLKEPIANVRIMNFLVTYISADKASTMVISNNKTNILQFLGMVNGLTWVDKRDNIKVIRQTNNTRIVHNVNLTDSSVFNSPAFYLQPGDVIYVEPNKRKFIETNVLLLNYLTTVTSTITVVFLFINNLTD